ncbi:MAG: PAS domain-containing protein, partial [Betaproteobacteria bacterium]|nr:PAS domain-containing protein [Betaproteobacteria bacterium]
MAVHFESIADPTGLSPLLQRALDRLNDIVIITTAAGVDAPQPKILYVNDAFERRTGYTREEALGNTPRMLQGELTQRPVLDTIRAALLRWEPVRCELINYTKAGQPFWLELDIVPLADDSGWYTHWVAIERDATDRKAREALAERSQRLDAVDQLSGGIAHDFNNVLTVAMGYAELLTQALGEQPLLSQMAAQITDAARRGSELTQRLLAFARRAPLQPARVDLPALLGEFRETLGRTLNQDITVRMHFDNDLSPCLIDALHLQNALLYLALNARDAMPAGGELQIAARNVRLADEQFADSVGTVSGDFVQLSLTDTGCGISPQ